MKPFNEFFNPDNIKGYDGFINMFFEGFLHGSLLKILAFLSLVIFVYMVVRKKTNIIVAILFYAIAFVLTYLTEFFKFLM